MYHYAVMLLIDGNEEPQILYYTSKEPVMVGDIINIRLTYKSHKNIKGMFLKVKQKLFQITQRVDNDDIVFDDFHDHKLLLVEKTDELNDPRFLRKHAIGI